MWRYDLVGLSKKTGGLVLVFGPGGGGAYPHAIRIGSIFAIFDTTKGKVLKAYTIEGMAKVY